MQEMEGDVLLFFSEHPAALPLYQALEETLFALFPEAQRRVQKTQITFFHRHVFACVSFARVLRKKDQPEGSLVLTLGLPSPLASARAAVQTEPYPGGGRAIWCFAGRRSWTGADGLAPGGLRLFRKEMIIAPSGKRFAENKENCKKDVDRLNIML